MSDPEIINNHRGSHGRCLVLPNVSVAEIRNNGISAVEHAHGNPHFWMMVKGRYQVEAAAVSRCVGAGALVYTAAGQPHKDHILSSDGHGLTVVFEHGYFAEQLESSRLPDSLILPPDPDSVTTIQRLREELYSPDSSTPLIVDGLSLQLLGRFYRKTSEAADGNLAQRAAKIIAQLYEQLDLSVAKVAKELGVHPVYLARKFREQKGISPADYIRSYRCRRAADLISHSTESLAEIAQSCGFGDQSSFTRAFRRCFSMTPGAFRTARRGRLPEDQKV